MPANGQLDDKFGSPFGDPFGDEEPNVIVEVAANADSVAPGGQLVVAAILDHADHWHSHLNEPVVPPEMEGFTPIATQVIVTSAGDAVTVGPIQWPEPHAVEVAFTGTPVEYLVYEGRAIAYVPLLVSQDAVVGESIQLTIEIEYQSCNDEYCDLPMRETRTLSVAIAGASAAAAVANADFDGFDPSVFARPWDDAGTNTQSVASPATGTNFFGIAVPGWDTSAGLAILGETCPQYLFLTADDLNRPGAEGAKYICSPPLRDDATQTDLWRHLHAGTLELYSSDHAPYRFDAGGKLSAGGAGTTNLTGTWAGLLTRSGAATLILSGTANAVVAGGGTTAISGTVTTTTVVNSGTVTLETGGDAAG